MCALDAASASTCLSNSHFAVRIRHATKCSCVILLLFFLLFCLLSLFAYILVFTLFRCVFSLFRSCRWCLEGMTGVNVKFAHLNRLEMYSRELLRGRVLANFKRNEKQLNYKSARYTFGRYMPTAIGSYACQHTL